MKKCYTCQSDKPISEFNKNKVRKDGLNSICRECSKARSKQYYKENPVKHKAEVAKRNRLLEKEIQAWIIAYLLKNPCEGCGESDILVLEFDHLHSKIANISTLMRSTLSIDKVANEIEKCRVLCANCHKRHTHKQINSYRYKYLMGA